MHHNPSHGHFGILQMSTNIFPSSWHIRKALAPLCYSLRARKGMSTSWSSWRTALIARQRWMDMGYGQSKMDEAKPFHSIAVCPPRYQKGMPTCLLDFSTGVATMTICLNGNIRKSRENYSSLGKPLPRDLRAWVICVYLLSTIDSAWYPLLHARFKIHCQEYSNLLHSRTKTNNKGLFLLWKANLKWWITLRVSLAYIMRV